MRGIVPGLHAAGGELITVGNGSPEQAAWYVEDFEIETPVHTDPTLAVYLAAGARRGLQATLHPRMLGNAIRAWRAGFRQKEVLGDGSQIGGVFIVLPDGSMPFRYLSRTAGDHPSPKRVAAAFRSATRGDAQGRGEAQG